MNTSLWHFASLPVLHRGIQQDNFSCFLKCKADIIALSSIVHNSHCRGAPDLVGRVFAVHAGSREFNSHRRHMSERFFRSSRPRYPHPVCSELENSGIRVAVCDCSVTERWLIKQAKLYMCTQTQPNTTKPDARRKVCGAMVPYR